MVNTPLFTDKPIFNDGIDGYFYGGQEGESRYEVVEGIKKWFSTDGPGANSSSTLVLLGVPKVGKTSTLYFALQSLEGTNKPHSIYLSAPLQDDLEQLKEHILGELQPIEHVITSLPRERLSKYRRFIRQINQAISLENFITLLSNYLPYLTDLLKEFGFSIKIVLIIEHEISSSKQIDRLANSFIDAGYKVILEQQSSFSKFALDKTEAIKKFFIPPLKDEEAARMILGDHPKNRNQNGIQKEYPCFCVSRSSDFPQIRAAILDKVGSHPGNLQRLCLMIEDVYNPNAKTQFVQELDVAIKRKAIQDYLKTQLNKIEELSQYESPEILEALMQWINTYHNEEINLIRPHEGILLELTKPGFAFQDNGIWTIPEYLLKHYSLLNANVKTLSNNHVKILVAWIIFIILTESHHRYDEIQRAIPSQVKSYVSSIPQISNNKKEIINQRWAIKEHLHQILQNNYKYPLDHHFEEESRTSISSLLSNTTIVGNDDALLQIYNNIGMEAQIGLPYKQYFGERDKRGEIVSKIVQWTMEAGKLPLLIEEFHKQLDSKSS